MNTKMFSCEVIIFFMSHKVSPFFSRRAAGNEMSYETQYNTATPCVCHGPVPTL